MAASTAIERERWFFSYPLFKLARWIITRYSDAAYAELEHDGTDFIINAVGAAKIRFQIDGVSVGFVDAAGFTAE